MVLVSPDYNVAWGARKELLLAHHIEPSFELKLTELVLTKSPKSEMTWDHRKWVCTRTASDIDYTAELVVNARLLTKYKRLYFGWAYRRWVVSHLDVACLYAERAWVHAWVSRSVSDASAFSYLHFVLMLLVQRSGALVLSRSLQLSLYREEMCFVADLSEAYPGHEATWNYYKETMAKMCVTIGDVNERGPLRMRCAIRAVDVLPSLRLLDEDLAHFENQLQLLFDETMHAWRLSFSLDYATHALSFVLFMVHSLRDLFLLPSSITTLKGDRSQCYSALCGLKGDLLELYP